MKISIMFDDSIIKGNSLFTWILDIGYSNNGFYMFRSDGTLLFFIYDNGLKSIATISDVPPELWSIRRRFVENRNKTCHYFSI